MTHGRGYPWTQEDVARITGLYRAGDNISELFGNVERPAEK